jgi:hypothetical protein
VNFDAPGVYQLAPRGKLEGLLAAAGFRDIVVEPCSIVSEYASLDAFLAPDATRTGAIRNALAELTPAEATRLKAILAEVVAPYTGPDGTIRLPMTPLCAAATK